MSAGDWGRLRREVPTTAVPALDLDATPADIGDSFALQMQDARRDAGPRMYPPYLTGDEPCA